MASGYVIAALLEAAGLTGLVLALVKIRAERRIKAAELRSFLRSGQSGSPALDISGAHRRTDGRARVVAIPSTTGFNSTALNRGSAAHSALRRAITSGGQPFRADQTIPLSAG